MKRPTRPTARLLVRRAFTMMEVLVVIVILSILLALITNVVKRVMQQADIEKTKATMSMIMKAVDRYYDEKKDWPPDLKSLMTVDSCKEILSNLQNLGIDGVVSDGFDTALAYSKDGGPGKRPRLTSNGPDRLPNTKDDIIYP